jgi:hypothetical protein
MCYSNSHKTHTIGLFRILGIDLRHSLTKLSLNRRKTVTMEMTRNAHKKRRILCEVETAVYKYNFHERYREKHNFKIKQAKRKKGQVFHWS